MIYVYFNADTPYCGTEEHYFETFPDGTPLEEIQERADELARSNGESYDYLVDTDEMSEEDAETEMEWYYDACECSYEILEEQEWNRKKEDYGYQ